MARNIIEQISPDELAQFDTTAKAFHTATWRQRRRAVRRNESLGIGVDGILAMATIPVLYLLTKIMEKAADHYAQQAATSITARIGRWTRRLLRRPEPLPASWQPTREQLAEIRKAAVRNAHSLGLDPAQSSRMADAIIAELATGPAKPTSERTDHQQ